MGVTGDFMKRVGKYFLILTLVLILWNSVIMKPLKIFTVFLHELGHSLMAFIFGYGIQSFNVNYNESGYVLAQSKGWFSSFMIANGGYLGSILFALLILSLKNTAFKNYILGGLAIVFLGITIKFSGFSFALLYAIIFAVFVIILYMLGNEKVNDWVIDIMGIAAVSYAIYDTFVDTILLQINRYLGIIAGWGDKQPMTDAVQLANMTRIPAIVWGIIWLAVSLIAINATLIRPSKGKK